MNLCSPANLFMRLLIPALLLIAFVASAAPPLPEVKLPPQAREAPPDEVQRLVAEHPGTGILDVRTAEEVAELGRLPGARHLDFFNEHFAVEIPKLGLDPAKPCVVYCAIGGRAKRAASALAEAGFKDIVLLSGGFNAWKKAGKPIEGGGKK
jgi:rhodanese-related sulfurtransferase